MQLFSQEDIEIARELDLFTYLICPVKQAGTFFLLHLLHNFDRNITYKGEDAKIAFFTSR